MLPSSKSLMNGVFFDSQSVPEAACGDMKNRDQKRTTGRIGGCFVHPDMLALLKRNLVNLYLELEVIPLHYISV